VCDRVAIIDHGRIVRQGTLGELVAGVLEVEVRVEGASPGLLAELAARWPRVARTGGPTAPSSVPDGAGVRTLRYALPDERAVAGMADLIVRDGARLVALVPHQATLEDLFIASVESREV
jgi:ABC-2 type transport system ATP-binding protein